MSVPIPKSLTKAVDLRVHNRLYGRPSMERFVTVRDLISSGVVSVKIGDQLVKSVSGAPTITFKTVESSSNGGKYTDPTAPSTPANVTAANGALLVRVSWDAASYANHSHSEIWRSDTEAGEKLLLGTSVAPSFVDLPGDHVSRYYWVRHVSLARVPGPFSLPTVKAAGKLAGADIENGSVGAGNIANGAVYRATLDNLPSTRIANAAIGAAHFDVGAIGSAAIENLAVNDLHVLKAGAGRLVIKAGDFETAAIARANFTGTTKISDAKIKRAGVDRFSIGTADIVTLNQFMTDGVSWGIEMSNIQELAVENIKIAGGALSNFTATHVTSPNNTTKYGDHYHHTMPTPADASAYLYNGNGVPTATHCYAIAELENLGAYDIGVNVRLTTTNQGNGANLWNDKQELQVMVFAGMRRTVVMYVFGEDYGTDPAPGSTLRNYNPAGVNLLFRMSWSLKAGIGDPASMADLYCRRLSFVTFDINLQSSTIFDYGGPPVVFSEFIAGL